MLFKARVKHDQKAGTIVLETDPTDLAPKIDAMLVGGERFNPKGDLHITVIGNMRSRVLREAGVTSETVAGLLDRLPRSWRVRRTDRWWRIEDPKWQGPEDQKPMGRSSLVEEMQCQEGEVFFAALSREARNAIVSPPFHVTWYFRRDPAGIALPSMTAIERLGTRIESMA